MSEQLLEVVRVITGTPFSKTQTFSIAVEATTGTASILVGHDSLVPLGALCLHAATNAPLGENDAIWALGVRHQAQSSGWQTITFRVQGDLEFSLTLEPRGAEALRDMLTYAIGASPPPPSSPALSN